MKIIFMILSLVLFTSCSKVENKEAIDCITNDTCSINETYFTKVGEWEEIKENVYTIEYKSHLDEVVFFTFDFNDKKVITTINDEENDYFVSAMYDWKNHKGSYTTKDGMVMIDGKSHQKILNESNHIDIENQNGSTLWKNLMSSTITPFKDTPLYPFELE